MGSYLAKIVAVSALSLSSLSCSQQKPRNIPEPVFNDVKLETNYIAIQDEHYRFSIEFDAGLSRQTKAIGYDIVSGLLESRIKEFIADLYSPQHLAEFERIRTEGMKEKMRILENEMKKEQEKKRGGEEERKEQKEQPGIEQVDEKRYFSRIVY